MPNIEISEDALDQAINALNAQAGAERSLASQEINTESRQGHEYRAAEYLATARVLEGMIPFPAGGKVWLALYSDAKCTDEITLPTGRALLGGFIPQVSAGGKIELVHANRLDMIVAHDDGREVRGMAAVDSRGRILHTAKPTGVTGPLYFENVSIPAGKFSLVVMGPGDDQGDEGGEE